MIIYTQQCQPAVSIPKYLFCLKHGNSVVFLVDEPEHHTVASSHVWEDKTAPDTG